MSIPDDLQSEVRALECYQQYEAALQYCKENNVKEKLALATGDFPLCTVFGLRGRRLGDVTNGEEFADRRILTLLEGVQLAKWIRGENRSGHPKDRDTIRRKIVEILEVRLKTRSTGRRYLPLSERAKAVVADRGINLPGPKWFQNFYAVFSDIVEEKLSVREDKVRAAKRNEAVIQNHFYGAAGLEAELKDATNAEGVPIMDEDGNIDPWRLAWLDECPNMVDFASEKGGGRRKKGAGVGEAAVEDLPENRECPSIMATQNLAGFMFGVQVNIARKYAHSDMAPESKEYRLDATVFDN